MKTRVASSLLFSWIMKVGCHHNSLHAIIFCDNSLQNIINICRHHSLTVFLEVLVVSKDDDDLFLSKSLPPHDDDDDDEMRGKNLTVISGGDIASKT